MSESVHPLPSGFYNSRLNNNKYDKVYSASEMSKLFDGLILDGVYLSSKDGDETNKQFVTTALDTPAMKVKTAPGRAWFNGRYIILDTETEYSVNAADSTYPRIDALVIEIRTAGTTYDPGPVYTERCALIRVVAGTPAENPVKPTMSQGTSGVYQYPIAFINVRKQTTTIENHDVQYVVGIDTPYFAWLGEGLSISELYSKWKVSLGRITMPFTTWFYIMRCILGYGDQDYYNMKAELDDIKEHPYVMGTYPRVDEQVQTETGDGETTDFSISISNFGTLADILVDGVIAFNYTFSDGVVSFEEAPADDSVISIYYVPTNNLETYTLYFEEVQNA